MKEIIKRIFGVVNLKIQRASTKSWAECTLDEYGYSESRKKGMPIDAKGDPIPWFTYPAYEFINQLNLFDKTIFEWGSGNSSIFFARKCKQIISVEHREAFYTSIVKNKHPNQQIYLKQNNDYINLISELNSKFDIIIIDGIKRNECGKKAVKFLKNGGVIILDNSDRYPDLCYYFRIKNNLLQVDMHGFGPINQYTWTTTLFFDRTYDFQAVDNKQPVLSIAGLKQQ